MFSTRLTVLLAAIWGAGAAHANPLPRYDHIVVVIEENHSFREILGPDSPAPYLRFLGMSGAILVQSFAVTHPSQPNYLALFSGSTQGVSDDSLPVGRPFSTPNLGAALRARGLGFAGFSESLPYLGFNGAEYTTVPGQHQYKRKHNPWANWQSSIPGSNLLPPTTNLALEHTFPTRPDSDFSVLPTVAFVVPDQRHDMHDGSIEAADTWLRQHLAAYATWAKSHHSLLIVTFDEDDGTQGNQIATIFCGAQVKAGRYRQRTNHYGILRTIEDIYGLAPLGESARARPLTEIFQGG